MHQFTRNEHKAPDISKAHTSVQDCGSSLFNLLHVLGICRWLLDFWTICGTLIPPPATAIIIIIIINAQIHFNICKEIGVQLDKKHWYEHVPNSVVTNQGGNVTILWNEQVQTDRTTPITSQT